MSMLPLVALLSVPVADGADESLRPHYHFTAERGYINDPNGLFVRDGTFHLFFQHGDIRSKSWGHATSTDLIRWTQHRDALTPADGHPVFSGCAVVDTHNTSGLGTAARPPVVAVFTEWGRGQSLASITDGGQTWTRYAGNPVLALDGDRKRSFALSARDPYVLWDEARRRWVMLLYRNREQVAVAKSDDGRHRLGFSVFTSPDLKAWTYRSHVPDFYVCPDLFRLPVGDKRKWVLLDWERYTVGEFDGETFTPEQPILPLDFGTSLSASQSWKLPDRTVQICWLRGGKYPGMPFDQQMSVPTELTLRRVGESMRLCKWPVRELASRHGERRAMSGPVTADAPLALDVKSHSYDLTAELELAAGDELRLRLLGKDVVLTADRVSALGKSVELPAPLTRLRVLADVTSLELFVNHGEVTLSFALLPPEKPAPVTFTAGGGRPVVTRATAAEVTAARGK